MVDTDGRAKRWTAHNAQRRSAVLDAAVEVIESGGVDITVKDIAERMGVPRPVVYRYFDGRADLDEQIRARILRTLVPELAAAMRTEGTVTEAVHRSIGTYLTWVERHPRLHHFLGSSSAVVSSARSDIGGRIAELFASGLDRAGQPTDFARPMAFSLLGMVDGAVNGWRSDTRSSLTATQVQDVLAASLVTLITQMAASFGIALTPDTALRDVVGVADGQA